VSVRLGIDIGGTKTAVGLVDEHRVLAQASAPTPARAGATAVLDRTAELVTCLLSERSDLRAATCGVGAAGVIEPRSGAVTSATDSISGWAGTDVRSGLEARLGIPVTVRNDVHAHAIGESAAGAGADAPTMLLVAAGTGIGGALVVDGRLQSGANGAAGHYGHAVSAVGADEPCPCGARGHVEGVAAGPALVRRWGGHADGSGARAVFGAAAAGDERAVRVLEESATAIGGMLAGLVNGVDPDVVVLAGGLADADRAWWSRIVDVARAGSLPALRAVPFRPAALGAMSAVVGAALLGDGPSLDGGAS
jgi:glucokinase